MNDSKKLIAAIVTGAGISVLCCMAFTSLTAPRNGQEKAAKIGYEADARPSAPSAPAIAAVADNEPRAGREPEQPDVKTSVTLTRQTRTTKAGKIAAAPRRQRAALNALAARSNTPQTAAPPPGTAAPEGSASVLARSVTPQEARAALKELGTNPAAEAVWIAAINDAAIPAAQRKDLIEDLNEEGFADPKHLTSADLPRIDGRLALIEELAPQAADQTNADAFQEAYKDLNDMRARLVNP